MTEPMVTPGSTRRRRPVLGFAVAVAVVLGAVAVYLASNRGDGTASVASRCDIEASAAPATPPAKPPTPVSAGRIGTIIGAAVTADTVVLNLSQDTEVPLRPARVLGVDPATFTQRWDWRYPAGGGWVQTNLTGRPADFDDPYVRVAGDVAMTVVGLQQAEPTLVGLDTATGRERWRVGFPTTSSPSVAYADPCIAVLSLRDTVEAGVGSIGLWAVDVRSGKTIWRGDELWRRTQSEIGECAVLPRQPLDTVYCMARAPVTASEPSLELSAVDARSGQLRWRADAVPGVGGPVGVDPLTMTVFLAMDNEIVAVDGRTGRLLWTVPSDPVRPVLAGPWLLVRTNGETLAYRVH